MAIWVSRPRFELIEIISVKLLSYAFSETFLICTFLPFMMLTMEELMPQPPPNAEEGVEFDFADADKMKEMIRHCMTHPKCETALKKYLPMLLHKGLLDV